MNLCTKKNYVFSLSENAPIPTDLRKDAVDIQKSLAWDDEGGEGRSNVCAYIMIIYHYMYTD